MSSFLMEYHGELISKKKKGLNERSTTQMSMGHSNCFPSAVISNCVDATFSDNLGRFVNDSDSNTDLKVVNVNKRPHVAGRNIYKGEEIRYDYDVHDLSWRHRHKENHPQVLLKR